MKLGCWFCGRPFDPVDVLAEGILEAREAFLGGPLYHYDCPGCRKENICERNARGRLLAHPRGIVPLMDRLQAWLDPALAREDRVRRAWWARNGGAIAWFHREFVAAIDAGLDPDAPASAPAGTEEPPPPPPPPPPPSRRDPHEVLGIPRGAPREAIVQAFRRLAKEHHPDLHEVAGDGARERARRRFVEIVEAYEALRAGCG